MHIRLDSVCHLKVDHERNVGNIDTSTSEIGRDEHVALARPDRVERRFSLLLVLARMQRRDVPLRIELVERRKERDVRERERDPSSTRRPPSSGSQTQSSAAGILPC